MRTARAVIGAGYGDEGKGVTVDALAAIEPGIVVRSNGGAQAGHTVVTPGGERHVFHHIGAGAFAGAATQLSQHFVLHPMFFVEERVRVAELGGNVQVGVDPRALVTTPYDIMINQAVEQLRGPARHGSCGFGFGETLERSLRPALRISMQDLRSPGMRRRLDAIRRDWVPERLRALGIDPKSLTHLLEDDRLIDRFLEDCGTLVAATTVVPDADALRDRPVIFEAAQGLMLDQDYGAFPHVTRSNTGIVNMVDIAKEAGIERIEAIYATRAYVTRHGAGPLDHDGVDMGAFEIEDPTNEPNDWQGSIRHAPLDVDVLGKAIRHDIARVHGIAVEASLSMTCLDQAKGAVPLHVGGERIETNVEDLLARTLDRLGLPLHGCGWGPQRGKQHHGGEVAFIRAA